MEPRVRSLRRDDDRSTFRSGDASLDAFFAQYAGQHQFKACASVTYVVERNGRIAGYATVIAACIDIVDLPPEDRLRYPYPAPVLSLARLATDERDRGRGIGSTTAHARLRDGGKMADELGCVGVVVDSKAGALRFYGKYGFKERPVVTAIADAPTPLFLKIATIKKAARAAPDAFDLSMHARSEAGSATAYARSKIRTSPAGLPGRPETVSARSSAIAAPSPASRRWPETSTAPAATCTQACRPGASSSVACSPSPKVPA